MSSAHSRAGPDEVFAMEEPQDALFRLSAGVITRLDAAQEAEA